MRDLSSYQERYNSYPYERYQVAFRKRKVLEILSHYPHNFIIEVGCGLNSILNEITDFKSLVVIEPGEVFYKQAVNDSLKHPKKDSIKLYNDFFEYITLPPNSFPDFILISSLLHEVENVDKILTTARKFCSKETIIHVNVPNANSFHRLLAVEIGLIKQTTEKSASQLKFQQNRIFDLEELIKVVRANGFKVIESGSYSFKPFTHQQMADMLKAGFITEAMLDGFYKMEKYLPGIGSEIFVNMSKSE